MSFFIFCPSGNSLRFLIKKGELLLLKHSLIFNKMKTKTKIFEKQGPKKFNVELLINCSKIDSVRKYKYLNSIENSKMNEASEIHRLTSRDACLRKFSTAQL